VVNKTAEIAYAEYRALRRGPLPARSRAEVQTVIEAAGLTRADVSAAFWARLNPAWLDGHPEVRPYLAADAEANARYADLARRRSLPR
jgi:hypothetical protein